MLPDLLLLSGGPAQAGALSPEGSLMLERSARSRSCSPRPYADRSRLAETRSAAKPFAVEWCHEALG